MGQGHLQEAQGQGLDLIPSAGATPGQKARLEGLRAPLWPCLFQWRLWSRNHLHQCSMGVS